MRKHVRPRRLATLVALTLAWCALWRDISAANILAGAVIAIVVTSIGVGTPGTGGIRLRPLTRLLWLVAVDLVRSTIVVAREILTPADRTEESIIAVATPVQTRDHLLLLVVAITLTPGTAVVDADPDTGTLYVHLLHHDGRDVAIDHINALARVAAEALPTIGTGS
ncbi:MAG: hypothetical protein HKN26_09955 [Acidimicrobiales bacterium]|nr:hypothetical protein [Acidimicrobiales bacterium]